MKKQLIVLFLLALCIKTHAQTSTFKAGGNYNADIANHKLGKLNFPSWEISYERGLCKKFSISGTYNYARRAYKIYEGPYWILDSPSTGTIVHGSDEIVEHDHAFIIEGRYYLKSNGSGFFVNFGIPFTYTYSVRYFITGQNSEIKTSDYFAISTIGGFGIKYPFSQRFGVEMNLNISPSFNFLDVDYGTSGFIKTGAKLFVSLNKSK